MSAHQLRAGTPGTEFIRQIAASPAALHTVVSERNGLGEVLCQLLIEALRGRPAEAGGGRRQGTVVVDATAYERVREQRRTRGPDPWKMNNSSAQKFVTQKQSLFTTNQNKGAMMSGLRVLCENGQLKIPRDAEPLIRELKLLAVEMTPSGNEKIAASTDHDDLALALCFGLGPYKAADGSWRMSNRGSRYPGSDRARDSTLPMTPTPISP